MMAEAVTAYYGSMDAEEAQRTGTAEMTRVVLGRVGTPAELAAAIVHLALDASYSTGSVVTVDGGFSARLRAAKNTASRREEHQCSALLQPPGEKMTPCGRACLPG
jgi:hypothetical protein